MKGDVDSPFGQCRGSISIGSPHRESNKIHYWEENDDDRRKTRAYHCKHFPESISTEGSSQEFWQWEFKRNNKACK